MEILTKKDIALCYALIDKGVQLEKLQAIQSVDALIVQWKKGDLDDAHTYENIYTTVREHQKHLRQRYDTVKKGDLLITVEYMMVKGLIEEKDIAGLSDDVMAMLHRFSQRKKTDL